jgi:hypothetical protein
LNPACFALPVAVIAAKPAFFALLSFAEPQRALYS